MAGHWTPSKSCLKRLQECGSDSSTSTNTAKTALLAFIIIIFQRNQEPSKDLSNPGKIPEGKLQSAITAAWNVWISICDKSLLKYEGSQNPQNVPRQEFLQTWAELLPLFTEKLCEKMSPEQMENVCEMLVRIISVPVLSDALPFLFTGCGDDSNLTNLQKIILSSIISLQKLAVYKVSHKSITVFTLLDSWKSCSLVKKVLFD